LSFLRTYIRNLSKNKIEPGYLSLRRHPKAEREKSTSGQNRPGFGQTYPPIKDKDLSYIFERERESERERERESKNRAKSEEFGVI
jgi:hypothetical protein